MPVPAAASVLPNDPLVSRQWHLVNADPDGFDLNLGAVWQDYRGAGVDAFVLDSGFDGQHPDLRDNYDSSRDRDFETGSDDASGPSSEAHGTAVMGLLGAAQNGRGTSGVAPEVTLVGYRLSEFVDNDLVREIARAIESASNDGADLISMSIGTQYTGNAFDQALSAVRMQEVLDAIDKAVDEGREGLGAILVKAAGNGRGLIAEEDANLSSWNAHYKVISVAAVDADGGVSSYSTPGANLLVSGFGSPLFGEVVTTDRSGGPGYTSGDYTYSFNGTSAATPMVSGVVALMLEANPDLGWRDVQAILAASARRYDETSNQVEGRWTVNASSASNGTGYHFSEDAGFGLVDAQAAVRLAEQWLTEGWEPATSDTLRSRSVEGFSGSRSIPDNNPAGTTIAFTGPKGVPEIEFVTLEVQLSHRFVGDLTITLTSPSGTTTTLLQQAAGSADHPNNWTYTANAFRGETANGTWRVTVSDSAAIDVGTVKGLTLTAFGPEDSANDRYLFTDAFSARGAGTAQFADSDGGRDQINAAAVSRGVSFDLGAGAGQIDGRALRFSGIEDVIGGDGNDSLLGSATGNHLIGARGDDDLRAGDGNDHLVGETGADSLRGQSGDDSLYGGSGSDELLGAVGNDSAWGGDQRDALAGGSGADWLYGGGSPDFLNGGSGADVAAGGPGSDTYVVDSLGDLLRETASGGMEDVLRSNALDYTLASGDEGFVERANLNGSAQGLGAARLVGNDLDNALIGNTAASTLLGRSGDDVLNGRGGDNRLAGGSGHDTFVVWTSADLLQERAGEGSDWVRAQSDFTLPDGTATAFVEHLRLQGGGADLNATGNSLDNSLLGNEGDNRLAGNQGSDRVEGLGGDDTLFGGAEGDRLFGGSGADTVQVARDDRAFGGSGDDDFRFFTASLSSGTQRISDFSGARAGGGDKLVFSTGMEQGSFAYIGLRDFSDSGQSEARFDVLQERLLVDVDGDGRFDIRVGLTGVSRAGQLTATDFLWL
ncbi:MAG: S8 family serine peptidase [Pseudomonadota bacterium]